jgi:serine/threonine protein phosphatase PrpC
VRAANEDAISIGPRVLTGDMNTPVVMTAPDDGCLLMVADGMGGHAQGAMASRAVLDHLIAAADRISNPESCAEAIEDANQHLYTLMEQQEAALGMGTTLVGAFLTPTALLTFNVGDSLVALQQPANGLNRLRRRICQREYLHDIIVERLEREVKPRV